MDVKWNKSVQNIAFIAAKDPVLGQFHEKTLTTKKW